MYRTVSEGQRGEVHDVNGDKVAVIFYMSGLATKEADNDGASQPSLSWLDGAYIYLF